MSRIDYSKWDHFGENDDESDIENDNDEKESSFQARVTRLDQPSTITTDSQGNIRILSKDTPQGAAAASSTPVAQPPTATVTKGKIDDDDDRSIPSSWTEKGAVITDLDNDGKVHQPLYYWSQDRLCVYIRVPIRDQDEKQNYDDKQQLQQDREIMTSGKKSYAVSVSNLLKYADRQAAVMTDTAPLQTLTISEIHGSSSSSVILLTGNLSMPVYLTEDDHTVDWCIETTNTTTAVTPNTSSSITKYIHIVLYKATPFPGMAIWWKKCFKEEAREIEMELIDRQKSSAMAFQNAWDEAHEQFRATVMGRGQP